MLRTLAVLVAVLASAACGPSPAPGSLSLPATSGGNSASGSRLQAPVYAVMADLLSDPAKYMISVVSWNGTVAAQFKAARRSSRRSAERYRPAVARRRSRGTSGYWSAGVIYVSVTTRVDALAV